jgi:hypothetical protein
MALGGARAGAGRKKGTKNKYNQAVADRLQELNCDPLEGMAIIANECMEEASRADNFRDKKDAFTIAGNMYKELIAYERPKLKSIEHKGESGQPITHSVIQVLPVASAG